jgi:hypothetical protein
MNSQVTNTPSFFTEVNPTGLQLEAYSPLRLSLQHLMTGQNHVSPSLGESQDSLIQAPQDMGSHGDFDNSLVSSIGPQPRGRKKKAPTLRAKDWEPYKARILDLHDTQNLPLETVKNMIENEFGFTAEYVTPLFLYHTCSESPY